MKMRTAKATPTTTSEAPEKLDALCDDTLGTVVAPGVRIRRSDENNTTIERRSIRRSKDGTESVLWIVVGYYASIKLAAIALLNRHFDLLHDEDPKDIKALIAVFTKAEERLFKAVVKP